jgi:hypothetical protein
VVLTTSQWIRRIADEKNLEISWEPISLFVKNEVQPDSKSYERVAWTHGLLRVMESVRAAGHEARLGDLYTEYGRRIHHEGERNWDAALALKSVGLDESHASAADDEAWDVPMLPRMNEVLRWSATTWAPRSSRDPAAGRSRGRLVRAGHHQGPARDDAVACGMHSSP